MKNLVFALLSIFSLFACGPCDEEPVTGHCEAAVIIDENKYQTAPDDPFFFQNVSLEGDCLSLTISYGGGCVDNLEINLIDAGIIMESLPVQRNIRISLNDTDDCEAIVTKEVSFDLSPAKANGENRVAFNLKNWDQQIFYQY